MICVLNHQINYGSGTNKFYCNLSGFVAEQITSKFLLRSDWTLAASGAAPMKLHYASMKFRMAGTANRLNIER